MAEVRSGWGLVLYPEAGEAGGVFRGLDRPGSGGDGWEDDPDRSVSEACRRARGKVRRYCAANRLNRFGTLTYAGEGCHEPLVARADVRRFFRRLRAGLGGDPLPYVWVPELHPGGHGFHFHVALGRHVPRGLIAEAWSRGFIHITLIGDLPVGSGAREEARVAARYLSKYLGKGFSAGGLNRYDVAQGFQPSAEPITGPTEAGVIGEAAERMGGPPDVLWRSVNEPGWRGPPGAVDVMAMTPAEPEVVRRWVEASCRVQGLPVGVSDGEATGRAATLLREGRRPAAAPTDARPV